jgi:biotin operon repressor
MFHEVAHGLGIKNTLDGKGTVREALTDLASSYEEGKADILGLYMIGKLGQMGELDATRLKDNYVTFLAGIFRSVRFGASSAHGQANMVAFNYLQREGAFARDETSGRYRVDFDKMAEAVNSLSARILTLQGDGDYAGAKALQDELGKVGTALQADLDRLQQQKIPVDIVLKQGREVLGL